MSSEDLESPVIDESSTEASASDEGADSELALSPESPDSQLSMPLTTFVDEFGEHLLQSLNSSNPPVYTGTPDPLREAVLLSLKRRPLGIQAEAIHTVVELLIERNEKAAILCGEMGCGKTFMGIGISAVLNAEGFRRTLVICPPHLVYKWRREILETVPGAIVWVLNGPDTLIKLIKLREQLGLPPRGQEFYILGRVRMRMGFHWRPAFHRRRTIDGVVGSCPQCGSVIKDADDDPVSIRELEHDDTRRQCQQCKASLWTLMRPRAPNDSEQSSAVLAALQRIPTIGPATAKRLIATFGDSFLASMLADNLYEFVNLMDEHGKLVFSDRQAHRMERALANMEFAWGEGGYQPTEYIKRYLPNGTFDLLLVDEAHEYKNAGSAQGQAMGVLAAKARKVVLLTGTLMGGYGDDLFYLLFRVLPQRMIEDGYRPGEQGSLTSAALAFMRVHGVLKDIYVQEKDNNASHKTARGTKTAVRTVKAPGFGPAGIMRCIVPFSVFVKLRDIGGNVLPPYKEEFREVNMISEQAHGYARLCARLTSELRQALARRDTTLLGVVLNVLLAWPDVCFRAETVRHPRSKDVLAFEPAQFIDGSASPKERELIEICRQEKDAGRKVLAYTTYTGTRDTTARLKSLLEQEGLRVAVLRSTIDPSQREDWIAEQLDRGIDVLVTNPDLVKTGLDLLEFPTIVFMQSGFNVYTVQQASRRSWRIGQKVNVKVIYLGYANTSQITCLELMAKKISVSQSTAGDVPESGLDALNQDGDSIEIALARRLMA